MGFFEYRRKKRKLLEVIRLEKLTLEEDNKVVVIDIRKQIYLCEALPWKEYKCFCRKY